MKWQVGRREIKMRNPAPRKSIFKSVLYHVRVFPLGKSCWSVAPKGCTRHSVADPFPIQIPEHILFGSYG